MNKWYMWINEALSAVGISLGVDIIATASQILGLVVLILNVVVLLVSLSLKVVDWVRRSKEDGKIDKDEIKELEDIVHDTTDKIDNINK